MAAAPDTAPTLPTESPTPHEPDVRPDTDLASRDETPLPTFVHGGTDAAPLSVTERPFLTRPAGSPVDQGWLPMLDGRSDDPEICPFLRAAAADAERLVGPIEAPDPARGIRLILFGLVFWCVLGLPFLIAYLLRHGEVRVRMAVLRLELQLAERGETREVRS